MQMKDVQEGSTADLEGNTWQRHPLSNVMYNTPEFTLKRIKDEEAERMCECGCYLCTYVRAVEQWSGALEWWDAD